jgi:hypothetical protein
MSQQPQGSSTTQTAKDEASSVARTAADSGGQVAGTARDEGQRVVSEAVGQARNLVGETRDQISQQAGAQQQKAADTVRTVSDELQTMASSSDQSGIASELVRQAADQAQQVARWLESRDPQGVLEDVRNFARRRPGAFLLGATVAGMAAGRLTRAGVDAKRDSSGADTFPSYSTQTPTGTSEGDLWPVGGSPLVSGGTGTAYDPGYTSAGAYDTGYDPVNPTQPAGTQPASGIPGTTSDPTGPPR